MMKKIEQFYNELGPKEQAWFLTKFSRMMINWFDGEYSGKQKSQTLLLTGSRYYDVDALAVAFLHLRPLFPPKVPRRLYRLTHSTDLRLKDKGPVTLTNKNQLKPLLSFSSRPVPKVNDRETGPQRALNGIVEWVANKEQVLASSESIYAMCTEALQLVESMVKSSPRDKELIRTRNLWRRLKGMAEDFADELEFWVYVQPNKPLKGIWRSAPDNTKSYFE